ncbi:MAG: hypothetical protein ACFFCW_29810 [Candidatus Hodarchaeota archaeon]
MRYLLPPSVTSPITWNLEGHHAPGRFRNSSAVLDYENPTITGGNRTICVRIDKTLVQGKELVIIAYKQFPIHLQTTH